MRSGQNRTWVILGVVDTVLNAAPPSDQNQYLGWVAGHPTGAGRDDRVTVPMPTILLLPTDVIDQALLPACDAATLLALSASCKTMRLQVDQPHVWELALHRRHRAAIKALFGGIVPRPKENSSHAWRRHLLAFDDSWLQLARQSSGRCLLQMSTDCLNYEPSYLGVPPPRTELVWKGTLSEPFTGTSIPICRLTVPWRLPCTDTVGIFDVTSFVPHHPGADRLLLDAAMPGCDATRMFDRASHSESARCILRGLVVPGLEAIPPLTPLLPKCASQADRGHVSLWECARARGRAGLWTLSCTYDAIFELSAGLLWAALESLLRALEGSSRRT